MYTVQAILQVKCRRELQRLAHDLFMKGSEGRKRIVTVTTILSCLRSSRGAPLRHPREPWWLIAVEAQDAACVFVHDLAAYFIAQRE